MARGADLSTDARIPAETHAYNRSVMCLNLLQVNDTNANCSLILKATRDYGV